MATAHTSAQQTYLPGQDDVAAFHDFLAAHERKHGSSRAPKYYLSGFEAADRVEIPREVYTVLRQVVEALRAGKAVTVASLSTRLTTQQAADLLMMSRPTLIKLLDAHVIPHERVSSRRTVLLADVLAYRESRRQAQLAALAATSVALDDEDDPVTAAQLLAQARAAVGRNRSS